MSGSGHGRGVMGRWGGQVTSERTKPRGAKEPEKQLRQDVGWGVAGREQAGDRGVAENREGPRARRSQEHCLLDED